MKIHDIIKNRKLMSTIVGVVICLLLVVGIVLSQVKYNNAIIYASEMNATQTVEKYQELGLLVKPSTINKIITEAEIEATALEEQATIIKNLEEALDKDLATSMNLNESEKKTLEIINTDYSNAKAKYAENITLVTGEAYINSLNDLQSELDKLQAENKARVDKEAKEKAEAEEKAKKEAAEAEDAIAQSNPSNDSGEVSSPETSNEGGGSPVAGSGKYTCAEIAAEWGVASIPNCSLMEDDGIIEYYSGYEPPYRGWAGYTSYGIVSTNYTWTWVYYDEESGKLPDDGINGWWCIVETSGNELVTNGHVVPVYI